MPEPYHIFGSDLVLSSTGDLLLVSGLQETTQRIIRRLLTNQGGYIWHLAYGAGLPAQVGQIANAAAIAALVRAQIFLEDTVAQTPAPTIGLTVNASGVVVCDITFTYTPTNETSTLTVPLT